MQTYGTVYLPGGGGAARLGVSTTLCICGCMVHRWAESAAAVPQAVPCPGRPGAACGWSKETQASLGLPSAPLCCAPALSCGAQVLLCAGGAVIGRAPNRGGGGMPGCGQLPGCGACIGKPLAWAASRRGGVALLGSWKAGCEAP